MSLIMIPSALPNVLLVIASRLIVGTLKIFKKWCYGTWGDNQNRSLQAEVFLSGTFCIACHQRQYRKCAGYARTMHGFGTDLVRNPAIWLMESRDYVNQFAYCGRIQSNAISHWPGTNIALGFMINVWKMYIYYIRAIALIMWKATAGVENEGGIGKKTPWPRLVGWLA